MKYSLKLSAVLLVVVAAALSSCTVTVTPEDVINAIDAYQINRSSK